MWMCHPHERPLSSSHQGVDGHAHITTPVSPQQDEIASLWTVPVWNSTNGKRIKVNALFGDAISVWYVNEELAGVPRLSVKYEEVTVNVLNDTVQTFDGMLLKMNLESCDGNIRIPLKALTCSRGVTGSYKAVDWLKYQDWWPHLHVCRFPEPAADPMIHLQIGQGQIDLHLVKADIRGKPG